MNADFVKRADLDFSLQLNNFSTKLGSLKDILGLTDDDVEEALKASNYFKFVVDMHSAHTERTRNWTSYKDLLRRPGAGVPAVSSAPTTLNVPVAPEASPMGIENWFRSLAKRIKGSANYTEAMGQDLGIVSSHAQKDTVNVKPVLKVQLVAGQPLIVWKKDNMDGVEIYKDNGSGNWQLLIFDTRPNHLDTSPLPPLNTSATWKYKAIYRYHDERVGSWSDEAGVVVSGNL